MDAAEEIPQPVRPEKKPGVDDKTTPHSPEQAAAVTKVLEDDNLLIEILLRLGFPTTLVCAALVCKRWLAHASNRKFLSHFCKLHPPRRLGYYITEWSFLNDRLDAPCFVPMLPQPPELATVIRRLESYSFDGHDGLRIMDCRKGSILTKRHEGRVLTHVVHRPLCPQRSMDIVPPLPSFQDNSMQMYGAILSKDEGSALSYWYVLWESTEEAGKSTTRVYMLQDGVWRMLTLATCLHGVHFCPDALLVDNKIYMLAASRDDIIFFDFTDSTFSTIQLPQGVNYHDYEGMLSRADDASSVYLIHVEDSKLRVWLHKGDNWLLVDTIRLHEMLAVLGMSEHTLEDEDIANAQIIKVGDNAQFVFLRMCHCIFYLDIKCRTLCKVYENTNDRRFSSIHPFMMIWPPTFPTLKDNPARDAM